MILITFFSAFVNVTGQRRRIFLLWYSFNFFGVVMQCLYYNWTRPLTLRLVRRLHTGVRRHQRIPQLAHSLMT